MNMIQAVIFDIDNTLTKKNSCWTIAEAVGMIIAEDLEIYERSKSGNVSSREIDRELLTLWQRKGLATRSNFENTFTNMELRDEALDVIDYLKRKKIKVCLITGSMDLYANIIAKRVGADDFYANTPLKFDAQGNVVDLVYQKDQAGLKLNQFTEFCQKNQLTPAECMVVGDSENDLLLFLETKQGIAIRTEAEDKILEPVAWKIVDNLSEIKQIV